MPKKFASLLMLCPLAVGGFSACGSSTASPVIAPAGAIAPTADEIRAAQAGSQAGSDGSEAGAVERRPAAAGDARGSSVQAATASTLSQQRSKCLLDAIGAGAALDAAAQNDLQNTVVAKISGNLKDSAGKAVMQTARSAPSTTITPLMFASSACSLGSLSLVGNDYILQPSDGAGGSVQVVADLTYASSAATTRVTSSDASRATYQLDTTAASTTQRSTTLFINEHRVRTLTATGKIDLDVTTQTANIDGVKVMETYAGEALQAGGTNTLLNAVQTRTLVEGNISTAHNLAKFSSYTTFRGLQHDFSAGCTCPVSGGLAQEVKADDGSRYVAHGYTFTGCGQATVSSYLFDADGATIAQVEGTVTFENCS